MTHYDNKNDDENDIYDCIEDKDDNGNDISDSTRMTNSTTMATKNDDKVAKMAGTNTTTPTRKTTLMTTVAKTMLIASATT